MNAVKKEEPKVVPLEELQEAIIAISKGMKSLQTTRLKEDTLVLLIQQAIKPASHRPSLDQIRDVLHVLPRLEDTYLKPVPKT